MMIALDTNILVRLLTRDDTKQAERARALLDQQSSVDGAFFIGDVVLAELAWTLERTYRMERSGIAKAMQSLLDNVTLEFESRDTLRTAVTLFAAKGVGFPDCMIVAKAAASGCSSLVTFDKTMCELPQVELL
jgi:predicted nucleic-acid-binding protein